MCMCVCVCVCVSGYLAAWGAFFLWKRGLPGAGARTFRLRVMRVCVASG